MKKIILFLGMTAVLTAVAGTKAMAYDHDSRGWYDEHHNRHAFIIHNHHRGYWDHQNGVRVFINI